MGRAAAGFCQGCAPEKIKKETQSVEMRDAEPVNVPTTSYTAEENRTKYRSKSADVRAEDINWG